MTKIRHRVPVQDCLRPQNRFTHLFASTGHPGHRGHLEMPARVQADADRNIRRFKPLDDEVPA